MNFSTFLVGMIFAAIIIVAARKSLQDFKAGKCAGCSCDCAQKKQKFNSNQKMPDKDKILL